MKLSVICLAAVVLVVCLQDSEAIFGGRRGGRGRGAGAGLVAAGVGILAIAKLGLLAAAATGGAGGLVFLGRKRRDIDNTVNVQLEREQLMEETLSYLDLAMSFDEDTFCVPRTMCEIMATTETSNSELVKFVQSLYTERGVLSDVIGSANHDGANTILEAGLIGKYAKDASACAEAFPKCSIPSNLREKIMSNSFSSANKY